MTQGPAAGYVLRAMSQPSLKPDDSELPEGTYFTPDGEMCSPIYIDTATGEVLGYSLNPKTGEVVPPASRRASEGAPPGPPQDQGTGTTPTN